ISKVFLSSAVNLPPSTDERRQKMNEEDRKESRKILLKYLDSCQGNYKMECWDTICVRINDFMNARKEWGKEENKDLLIRKELKDIKGHVTEEVKVQLERHLTGEVEGRQPVEETKRLFEILAEMDWGTKKYSTALDFYKQVSNSESTFKYDAKYLLALHYDRNNYHQKVFELYLNIYIGKHK
ncbi:9065_t:CDS:2, partial [Scutellospora calospora]